MVEPLLAAHTRVISYDRAGIGASTRPERSQTPAELSARFAGLLAALGITEPVVVVGQSYGGLISGLHAALQPRQVRGIVQLDPTIELSDARIDALLAKFTIFFQLSAVAARLGLRNPVFTPLWSHFPPDVAERMETLGYRSSRSLLAAKDEVELLGEIRASISQNLDQRTQPRLVISAGVSDAPKGWVAQKLISVEKRQQVVKNTQGIHQRQAARGKGGMWELAAEHSHGGLVATPAGAAWSAERVLRFLKALAARTA